MVLAERLLQHAEGGHESVTCQPDGEKLPEDLLFQHDEEQPDVQEQLHRTQDEGPGHLC